MKKISLFVVLFFVSISLNSCDAKDKGQPKNIAEMTSSGNSGLIYSETDLAYNNQIAKNTNEIANSRQNAITEAIRKCNPAIVGINITEVRQVEYRDQFFDDPFFRYFFGQRHGRSRTREYEVQGLGSGFLISPDGYILTNHHVAGNASKIIVTMTDGNEFQADIIGSDMVTDVALLKIDGKNLPYLNLGNSDDVIIGEWAIAFGNPFGLFDINAKPTVTVGVISNSDISFLHRDKPLNRVYRNMLQTDAAISSGNSGGPLVNSNGDVIGMNTMIFSTSQSRQGAGSIGIGFSIPINRVKNIVDMLKKHQTIDRNFYIGMGVRELDEKLANYLNLDFSKGVVVFELKRKGPAENQGFQLGDIILEINGERILREDDYLINIFDATVGDVLDVKVLRENREINLKLKPDARE